MSEKAINSFVNSGDKVCLDLGLNSNEILVHTKGEVYFMDRTKLRDSLMIPHNKSPHAIKVKDNKSIRSGRSLQILKPLNSITIVEAARA